MSLGWQCVSSCIKVKALHDEIILNTEIRGIGAEHMEGVCARVCARDSNCPSL